MELLKDKLAGRKILREVSRDLKKAYPELDNEKFSKTLLSGLNKRELKNRILHLTQTVHRFLPGDYPEALKILYRFINGKACKFIYIFLPTFVMCYGRAHYKLSMRALRDFTEYSTSEEGVRPYLEDNLSETLRQMMIWAQSDSVHIRRLASEGCRPRLPWAKRVDALIQNPEHTYPILCRLNSDTQKYVQKSVANHINDISKDHPEWIVRKLAGWDITDPSTLWIVKHGLRTLIKQGNKTALKILNSDQKPEIILSDVKVDSSVRTGEKMHFSFTVTSDKQKSQQLMIDYRIHFCRKGNKTSCKTFKLKSLLLEPHGTARFNKHYHFKDYSTRSHYAGEHRWELLINGETQVVKKIILKEGS